VGVQISVGASQSQELVASVLVLVPTTLSTSVTSTLVYTSGSAVVTSVSVLQITTVSSITSASLSSATATSLLYPTATNSNNVVAYTGMASNVKAPVTGLIAIMLALVL